MFISISIITVNCFLVLHQSIHQLKMKVMVKIQVYSCRWNDFSSFTVYIRANMYKLCMNAVRIHVNMSKWMNSCIFISLLKTKSSIKLLLLVTFINISIIILLFFYSYAVFLFIYLYLSLIFFLSLAFFLNEMDYQI